MFEFVQRSLRTKIVVLVLGITFACLVLTGAILILYDLRTQREAWVNDLTTQADLVGTASAPALSFQDSTSAHENLALLRVRPHIESAALFTLGGERFAAYAREGTSLVAPAVPPPDGAHRTGNRLELVRAVRDADERVGTIWIAARFDLAARLWSYLGILAMVTVLALALAALLSSRLQSAVTRPVIAIAEAAKEVRERHDFSVRVQRSTRDETGVLVDAFNELLERVGQHTGELEAEMAVRQRAEAALTEANRRKDDFLATLGHELRNPLAPIRNAIYYLSLRPGNDPEVAKTLAMAERQVKHMVRLIDDLLDISRITRDTLELRLEPFELGGFVEELVEASGHAAAGTSHDLAFSAPEHEVHLVADRARLLQAIGNVIHNAIRYTPDGGRIRVEAISQDDRLSIVVTDTGIGNPKDRIDDIFQPFVQLDRSLEKARGGLGIGLALAQRIVALHGGTLTAESEGPDRGSTFRIELPAAGTGSPPRVASVAAPTASAGGEPPARPIRVLVADDNVDSAESMALLLARMGHAVTTAHDGLEAVRRAEETRPELALLDIGMPGLNGYQVASRIRGTAWGKGVRLVALTGWGQSEDKAQATAAGFDAHLTKPVDMEALRALVAAGAGRT
jgi:signal transduction histidine kinase